MNREQFWFTGADRLEIAAYRWPAPAHATGIVQVSHGMAEHAQRYDHVAAALNRGRVEMWRGGCRCGLSVAGPFVCRCLTSRTLLRFHIPLIEPDVRN